MTDKQWTLEELTLSAEQRWRFEARATVATIINDAYMARSGRPIADDHWLDEISAKIAEVMWTVESSRRDWAAEAGNATSLLAQFVDQRDGCRFDHHGGCQTHGFLDLQPGDMCPNEAARLLLRSGLRNHAEKVCACISDDQATHLGPRFSRPVCAVHPSEESA